MPIPDSQITITDQFGEQWRFWAEGLVIHAASDLQPTPWITITIPALPFSLRFSQDGCLHLSSGPAIYSPNRHYYRNPCDAEPALWEEE